jgi:hypothetical protein
MTASFWLRALKNLFVTKNIVIEMPVKMTEKYHSKPNVGA